jgi:hypothetical protein
VVINYTLVIRGSLNYSLELESAVENYMALIIMAMMIRKPKIKTFQLKDFKLVSWSKNSLESEVNDSSFNYKISLEFDE